jgi:hypothetical protein
MPTLDSENFSRHQRLGHISPRPGQNPSVGLSGYIHPLGCGVLIQTFKIAETYGLQPFHRNYHLVPAPGREGVGYETGDQGSAPHKTRFGGSRHLLLHYEHLIIT